MWIRRIFSSLFLALLICGAVRAGGLAVQAGTTATWNGTMYVSPDQVVLEWDAANDTRVTHYEVQALWIDQDPPQVVELGTTNATNMTVQRPRTGHFEFRVRSVSETKNMTSEWAESTDTTDGPDPAWRIYFTVPSVDGISVD